MATGLRQTLGTPELTLDPAYSAEDVTGAICVYPPDETVRWDIGAGCMVQVEHVAEEDQPLRLRVSVGPDFPIETGRELRAITPDQLRRFACQLIALAEHAGRQGGGS